MLWDVSGALPFRSVVLVGDRLNSARWLIDRRPACPKAERVIGFAGLWGLKARATHVVLLPSYREFRRWRLLRIGIWFLQVRGATVERP